MTWTYILLAVVFLQFFAIAVLVMAVTASSEIIEDLQKSLRFHKGEH
jgi:hypothetical protein